jgi:hypothetical protein
MPPYFITDTLSFLLLFREFALDYPSNGTLHHEKRTGMVRPKLARTMPVPTNLINRKAKNGQEQFL